MIGRRLAVSAVTIAALLALPTGALADSGTFTCGTLQAGLAQADDGDVITLTGMCNDSYDLPPLPSSARWTLRADPAAGTDGFDGDDTTGPGLSGGSVGNLEIQGLLFRNWTNTEGNGGAIRVQGASGLAIRDSQFFNNHASKGGAVFISSSSAAEGLGGNVIDGSTFGSETSAAQGNTSRNGGGAVRIEAEGAGQNSSIHSSLFAGNATGDEGGAFSFELEEGGVENIAVFDNRVVGNTAVNNGGGGHVSVDNASLVQITGNVLQANTIAANSDLQQEPGSSHVGAGLYVVTNSPNLVQRSNTFQSNSIQEFDSFTSYYAGGGEAIRMSGGVVSGRSDLDRFFLNSIPASPPAEDGESEGGGLAILNSANTGSFHMWLGAVAGNTIGGLGDGGGIYVGNSGFRLSLSDTTVAGNSAGEDGEGHSLGGGGADTLVLRNSIIFSPPLEDIAGFSNVDSQYSLACKPISIAARAIPDFEPFEGTGNICDDPLLKDPQNADIHQTANSPTIDAGSDALFFAEEESPTVDFEGDPRPTDHDGDGHTVDMGADESPGFVRATPTPGGVKADALCGRRAISLVRADLRRGKVRLTGLVSVALANRPVTIWANFRNGRRTALRKIATVRANSRGQFSATVARPRGARLFELARYQARIGRTKSPSLKLPQSLTSSSARLSAGKITIRGKVKRSLLGKRNRVVIKRLVCGRYRTVGSARPNRRGGYTVTFTAPRFGNVAFYRAESRVRARPGAKKYVTQYARAISISLNGQTG